MILFIDPRQPAQPTVNSEKYPQKVLTVAQTLIENSLKTYFVKTEIISKDSQYI